MKATESAFDNFFDTAILIDDHKPAYTVIYMTILHLSRQQRATVFVDAVEDIRKRSKISRDLVPESLRWLDKHGYIKFFNTPNGKLPSKITLILDTVSSNPERIQSVSRAYPESDPHTHVGIPAPARAEVVVNNNLVTSNLNSSSLNHSGLAGSVEYRVSHGSPVPASPPADDDDDDDDELPFVKQHREQARQYAQEMANLKATGKRPESGLIDRHPPIDDQVAAVEETWCIVEKVPYTRSGFEKLVHSLYKGQKGEVFHMKKGYPYTQYLQTIIDHRAMNFTFTSPRKVMTAVERYSEDLHLGKIIIDKPKPKVDLNQGSVINYGSYEIT